ncbi:MspA family porin [Nocardia africana]|uniref:MspA n=1 Tax=Nocardia africana TaxID=134964 RepID=A0A379X4X9_9NOCA|nr:MspA family porin [Nocardia africana]MCC3318479.1 MspA family porin [Nocardia africana]SUH71998.1 MspA [Nocardia africana]
MKHVKTVMTGAALAAAACVGLPSVAQAEVITLAPHERTITTEDGWNVKIRLEDESWNKVPTTNMTGTSREGYGSLRAVVEISGKGDTPLKGAQVSVGYVMGCFATLNSVNPGIQLNVGPNIGFNVGPIDPGVRAGVGAFVQPSVNASISPGQIQTVPVSSKNAEKTKTVVQVREAHMSMDGCLGPLQVRAYASVGIDTKEVKDGTVVYGDTFPI